MSKQEYPEDHNHAKKLTPNDEFLILQLTIDTPGIQLHEIQTELACSTGTCVNTSTICRFLYKSGFTRKKLQTVALQRSEELRQKFVQEMTVYNRDMFVFVDETGSDRRDSLRRYGYSLRGKPARSQKLLVRGKRVSAIGALSGSGMLGCHMVEGSVNADTFEEFIEKSLLPNLCPFNGTNPHSVVVMDNCSIHHVERVIKLIESTGSLVVFLPPYSPDLNPIELAFAHVKAYLKANEMMLQATNEITEMVLMAFATITQTDCLGWLEHCGY